MIIDLSPAKPYLDAVEIARNFPALVEWIMEHETGSYYDPVCGPHEEMMEEAMEIIDRECPHLWPYIDRAVLAIVDGNSRDYK
jgi:hypothetical protein